MGKKKQDSGRKSQEVRKCEKMDDEYITREQKITLDKEQRRQY